MEHTTTITKDELRRRAGLFNIGEAAVQLGIDARRFRYQLDCGVMPQPTVRIGSKPRRYYSQETLQQLQRFLESGE